MPTVLMILLTSHVRARLRRLTIAFSTPRRIMLSMLILALVVVWTGQTVVSMMLRTPYAPDVFRIWVAVPLFAWFVWHIVRVAWKRPDTAIEWSEAEEALIVAGPFSAQQQLAYRFSVILTATLPKAVLTILVLLPDLSWSSPAGLILALVGLETFRMVMDIGTSCLSNRVYQGFRVGVVALLSLTAMTCQLQPDRQIDAVAIVQVDQLVRVEGATQYLQSLVQQETVSIVAFPFLCVADVITAQGSTSSLITKSIGMVAVLLAMSWLIYILESMWHKTRLQRERRQWQSALSLQTPLVTSAGGDHRLPRIPLCGPLVWRQCRRALRHGGSLLISMAIPALMLSPFLTSVKNPGLAFLVIVCGALFYSFVLLPEAIKFDFRLDSDHLCQLKLLPMTPTRIVFGQLATPVLLACLFQTAIFVAAGVYRSVDPQLIVAAVVFSLPLTVLFVALDNLVFLLYPHRPTQEGFAAFVRTILKFTGKSVLMALFAAAIMVWAPLSAAITALTPFATSTSLVFAVGILLGVTALAGTAVAGVVSAFGRFDVSLHGIG
jgi:hypothetical protein